MPFRIEQVMPFVLFHILENFLLRSMRFKTKPVIVTSSSKCKRDGFESENVKHLIERNKNLEEQLKIVPLYTHSNNWKKKSITVYSQNK